MDVRWLDDRDVVDIFRRVCAAEGSADRGQDDGKLRLALERPRVLAAGGGRSLFELAAAYAWGFARYGVFASCQPEASREITVRFLEMNGSPTTLPSVEARELWEDIHQGRVDEQVVAEWIRERVGPEAQP
ncbi:hypothetical protein ACLBX9_12685 [Methylobacterium sp. A49B]